jgi:hypothetical protein
MDCPIRRIDNGNIPNHKIGAEGRLDKSRPTMIIDLVRISSIPPRLTLSINFTMPRDTHIMNILTTNKGSKLSNTLQM